MSYTINLLKDKGVLLVTWHEDFNFMIGGEALTRDILQQFELSEEPVYFIGDLRKAAMTFDELMASSSASARGDNPLFKHPKIRDVFTVSTSAIMQMAARGLDSDVFNNTKVTVVETVEKALEIIERGQG